MSELIDLTAAEAAARVRAKELDPSELFNAYRDRAAAEDLNAFLWVAPEAPATGAADAPLGGVPFAAKDLLASEDLKRAYLGA